MQFLRQKQILKLRIGERGYGKNVVSKDRSLRGSGSRLGIKHSATESGCIFLSQVVRAPGTAELLL